MNTSQLRRVRRIFEKYDWTPAQRRVYARKWVTSIRYLGKQCCLPRTSTGLLPDAPLRPFFSRRGFALSS